MPGVKRQTLSTWRMLVPEPRSVVKGLLTVQQRRMYWKHVTLKDPQEVCCVCFPGTHLILLRRARVRATVSPCSRLCQRCLFALLVMAQGQCLPPTLPLPPPHWQHCVRLRDHRRKRREVLVHKNLQCNQSSTARKWKGIVWTVMPQWIRSYSQCPVAKRSAGQSLPEPSKCHFLKALSAASTSVLITPFSWVTQVWKCDF